MQIQKWWNMPWRRESLSVYNLLLSLFFSKVAWCTRFCAILSQLCVDNAMIGVGVQACERLQRLNNLRHLGIEG